MRKKNTSPTNDEARKYPDTLDKDNLAKKVSVKPPTTAELCIMLLQNIHADIVWKLGTLIDEERTTRKTSMLVNSNLAEIIAILKDQKRSETEKGKGY